jgi:hypothetical protein
MIAALAFLLLLFSLSTLLSRIPEDVYDADDLVYTNILCLVGSLLLSGSYFAEAAATAVIL